MTISIPEFQAMIDVLDDTVAEAVNLPLDEAIDVHAAIDAVRLKCRLAQDALELAMQRQLETAGTVRRGGREYEVSPFDGYTYDHDTIARRVAEWATYDHETGEKLPAERAASEAARAMKMIYASPSTPAKTGSRGGPGLALFDIDPRDVREANEHKRGKRVVVRSTTTPDTDLDGRVS